MEVSELISRLRRERGLTQTQLAELAGCSMSTIQVAESAVSSRSRKLSRSNALRLLRALASVVPLQHTEAVTLLEFFDLGVSLAPNYTSPAPPSAQAPRVVSTRENTAQLFSTAVRLLGELIELRGPDGAAEILRRAIDEAKASPERPQRFEVIHPPQQSRVPGAVEQTIVGYEPPKKSAAAIKRARKA